MTKYIMGAGGGGCFPAGTKVMTPAGEKAIEQLVPGDEVVSFDASGRVGVSRVEKLHTHPTDPILKLAYWGGELRVTANHWVLNQYNTFALAGTLTEHDAVIDSLGHLRPVLSITADGEEAIYNLTVTPDHTFIADNIRVHNGGRGLTRPVIGAGGGGGKGGGGSARAAVEDPDSLQSTQYAQIIDLVSEGEIGGLVNGLASVYLDGTPVQNPDGSLNFTGVTMDWRNGAQDQTPLPGFSGVESENQVSVEIKRGTNVSRANSTAYALGATVRASSTTLEFVCTTAGTSGTSVPTWPTTEYATVTDGTVVWKAVPMGTSNAVTRTISSPNADAVRVTVSVPQLTYQDTSTGDLHGSSVELAFDIQENGGGFVQVPVEVTWNTLDAAQGATGVQGRGIGLTFTGEFGKTYGDDGQATFHPLTYVVEYKGPGDADWKFLTTDTVRYVSNQVGAIRWLKEHDIIPARFSRTHYAPVGASGTWYIRARVTSATGTVTPANTYSPNVRMTDVITGKTTSRYRRAYYFNLNGDGPWDVRVRRITADSTSSNIQNKTWWESYTEVIESKLSYPNSAIIGAKVDARQFQSIPRRGYEIYGIKCRIPSNYDPRARTYTGLWDGTFKTDWTNNPAWVLYDIIVEDRYGLGGRIPADLNDKWALYEIGKYCDGMVPSGFGSMEPRFTCNVYIQTRDDAYKLLANLASVFRGMSYWLGGMVTTVADMPSDPVGLFANANVIDGMFNYSGSSRATRHTVALVTWNDPSDLFRQKVEYVEDPVGIARYGVVETEVVAFGCTSRGQAHRLGKWILYTERLETETVSFRTGLEGATVYPGVIIKIADTARSGDRIGGRLLNATATAVTLDAPVTIGAGATYTLSIITPEGLVEDRTVTTAAGTTTELTVNPAFTAVPQIHAMWVLASDNLEPQTFRVVGVAEREGNQVEVSAVAHHPGKYDLIEYGIALDEVNISSIELFPPTPTALSITESLYLSAPGTIGVKINASWEGDAARYVVAYRRVGGNYAEVETLYPLVEILGIAEGTHEFQVYAVNTLGKRSLTPVKLTYTVLGKTAPPSDVGTITAELTPKGIALAWSDVPDLDLLAYEVRIGSTVIFKGKATQFVYPKTPLGTTTFTVRALDTTGHYSLVEATTALTVVAPTTPTLSAAISGTDIVLTIDQPAPNAANQLPLAGYVIRYGSAFVGGTDVVEGVDNVTRIRGDFAGERTFWAVSVDADGNQSTPTSVVVTVNAPAAPVVSSTVTNDQITLSWTQPASSLTIVEYEVRHGASFATGVSLGKIAGTSLKITGTWLGVRNFHVAATDSAGTTGAVGPLGVTIAAPATPTVTSAFEGELVKLTWTDAKTTLPIVEYEVREGASWALGTTIAKPLTNTYSLRANWSGNKTYWVAAKDSAGNIGTAGSASVTPGAPSVPQSFVGGFTGTTCTLTWVEPATHSLPIDRYEVRTGATWATGSKIAEVKGLSAITAANWTGSKTFFIAAIDTAGNVGAVATRAVAFVAPGAVTPSAAVAQTEVKISWPASTGGSLPVEEYEVRYGGVWASGVSVAKVKTTTLTVPIDWTGARTFWVAPIDSSGNYGTEQSVAATVNVPSAPSVSSSIVAVKAQLSWTVPASTLPIKEYEIRQGASFAAGSPVATLTGTNYRVAIDWTGSRTFWVASYDQNGNLGAAASAVVEVSAPQAPTVTPTIAAENLIITWTEPGTSLPIAEYEIRHGASWAAGTTMGRVKGTILTTKVSWVGARTFWVAAVDVNGNVGAAGTANVSITAPSAPNIQAQVIDNNVLMYWAGATGTLPIATYEIRKGATWETSEMIGQKSGGFTTVFETASGTYTYWVAAIDSAGNYGTPASASMSVAQPPDYILKADYDLALVGGELNVVSTTDKNANLTVVGNTITCAAAPNTWKSARATVDYSSGKWYWEAGIDSGGTYPNAMMIGVGKTTDVLTTYPGATGTAGVGYYADGKKYQGGAGVAFGATYTTGDVIGIYLDADAGTVEFYKNGTKQGTTLTIGAGPWFPMFALYRDEKVTANFGATEFAYSAPNGANGMNNTVKQDGKIILPVNVTETFSDHFSTRAWTSPQSQITAGFPVFIQPAMPSGYYEEVIDYGTVLAATKVTVTPTMTTINSPTLTTTISTKLNAGDAWTDYTGSFAYLTNFRYLKVRITVTSVGNDDLVEISQINVRLDAKIKNDAGMVTCAAADAGGTQVNFNIPFVDVASIQVTPQGTTPLTAIYDFTDTPDPTGFKVLLFNAAGARVSGTVSWAARGY